MDDINNTINTDKLLNDTKNHLINQIKNSKVFAGNLLAKTSDTEGYTYTIEQLDRLIDMIEGRE